MKSFIKQGGEYMASNAINKIKDAEEKARNQLEEAKGKTLTIQNEMKNIGTEKYNSIIKEAELERLEILKVAREKGKEIEEPILKNAEESSKKILESDKKILDEVTDLIVERIVKDYVDS